MQVAEQPIQQRKDDPVGWSNPSIALLAIISVYFQRSSDHFSAIILFSFVLAPAAIILVRSFWWSFDFFFQFFSRASRAIILSGDHFSGRCLYTAFPPNHYSPLARPSDHNMKAVIWHDHKGGGYWIQCSAVFSTDVGGWRGAYQSKVEVKRYRFRT